MGLPASGGRTLPVFLLSLVLVVAFVGLAIDTVPRGKGDIKGYIEVGKAVLGGRSPYLDVAPDKRVWPPAFILCVVPIAYLATFALEVATAVWQIANLLALWWALALVARLVHGSRLTLDPRGGGQLPGSAPILVPLALVFEGVTGNFQHVQVNLILFALVLQGLAWQARGRSALGGLAIGFAAALKVMPVVFLPYLLWRRRWRAAAWTLAGLVAFSLAPIAVFGWEHFVEDVSEWRRAMALGWDAGWMNQSMPATWDRFLGHGIVPFVTAPTSGLLMSGSPAVASAVWATRGLAAALAAWLFRGPMRPDGRTAVCEWSVVFIVGAVFGQVSWKSYHVVLLLPCALLFSLARDPRCSAGTRRGAAALLVVVFVLSLLASPGVFGRHMAADLQMAGTYAIAATIVLFGLLILRRRLPREPETPSLEAYAPGSTLPDLAAGRGDGLGDGVTTPSGSV